jgi:hypothetical protein
MLEEIHLNAIENINNSNGCFMTNSKTGLKFEHSQEVIVYYQNDVIICYSLIKVS